MLRPEDIRSLTDFKRNTLSHVRELQKSGRPRILTTKGKAQLVVQDAAAYQKLLDDLEEALAVAGIQRGRADAKAGRTVSADAGFASIRRRSRLRRAS